MNEKASAKLKQVASMWGYAVHFAVIQITSECVQ